MAARKGAQSGTRTAQNAPLKIVLGDEARADGAELTANAPSSPEGVESGHHTFSFWAMITTICGTDGPFLPVPSV